MSNNSRRVARRVGSVGAAACALCAAAAGGTSPAHASDPSTARRAGSDGPVAPASPPSMSWEHAFPVEHARADVHIAASYVGSDNRAHRLEIWRHGTTFLRRRTDDTLDLYVAARPGGYAYQFFDQRRHVVTGVSRDNLYRIGVTSDWFGLAHVLDRPKVGFEVRAIPNPHPEAPRRDCVWRELVIGGKPNSGAARICWSAKWGTALLIEQRDATGAWAEKLSVRGVGFAHFGSGMSSFPPIPVDYAYVDADREIAPQAGD